jgi:hypothetical protein
MYQLTERALQLLMNLFIARIKERLLAKDYPYGNPDVKGTGNKYASGQLYNSIQGSIEIGPNGEPIALIQYQDYFNNVNRGRQAGVKRVPLKALMEWIKVRGLKGRDKKGRFMSTTNLAWAIQTNIFKYGVRPANIYDAGIDDLEAYFNDFPNNLPPDLLAEGEDIFEAVAEDINAFIEQTLTKEIESINNIR